MMGYPEEGEPEVQLELYAVGNNLYGFVSEWGFAALEFFPVEDEDFSSTTADSMLVDVQTFSIQSNMGEHWNRGIPIRMRMTLGKDEVTFTNFAGSGSCGLYERFPYLRGGPEPGHIDAFCYREYADILAEMGSAGAAPGGEIVGLWRLLGEADWAPFIEFTPDGLVQYYLKTGAEVVTLWRGGYTAERREDGTTDVRMILIGLGMSSQPSQFELYCRMQPDGSLICCEGEQQFGEPLFWDGAMLLPVTPEDIPAVGQDNLPVPGSLAFAVGEYRDVWDMELSISGIGAFYYYPADDSQNMEYMIIGYVEETPDCLVLHAVDQETGEESVFAEARFANYQCLILEFSDGGVPQPFVMENTYARNTNRLEGGDWYHVRGESSIHHYGVLEDGRWYGYGMDPESEEEIFLQGSWQPADGGGDYRGYVLLNEDGSFYDFAQVFYSVEDGIWVMALQTGDVYG